jgi:hypothetical protein
MTTPTVVWVPLAPGPAPLGIRVVRQYFRRSHRGLQVGNVHPVLDRGAAFCGLEMNTNKPTSSRSANELQPAYELVAHLLRDAHPAAWERFLHNGTAVVCEAIPELSPAVEKFVHRTKVGFAVAVFFWGGPFVCGGLASSTLAVRLPLPVWSEQVSSPGSSMGESVGSAALPTAPVPELMCHLCGGVSTSTGLVKQAYGGLAGDMVCPEGSIDHSHCRTFLRRLGQSCSGAAGALGVMSHCYPVEVLEAFLAPEASKHSLAHRRCRGGLLALLRYLAALKNSIAGGGSGTGILGGVPLPVPGSGSGAGAGAWCESRWVAYPITWLGSGGTALGTANLLSSLGFESFSGDMFGSWTGSPLWMHHPGLASGTGSEVGGIPGPAGSASPMPLPAPHHLAADSAAMAVAVHAQGIVGPSSSPSCACTVTPVRCAPDLASPGTQGVSDGPAPLAVAAPAPPPAPAPARVLVPAVPLALPSV